MFPMFLATPVVRRVNLATCWDSARTRTGIKHEAAAALMGITATQLSAEMHGKGHPSLWRLLMLLDDTDGWRLLWAFFDEIATEAGREEDTLLLLQRAESALVRERRMAKASLTPQIAERKTA